MELEFSCRFTEFSLFGEWNLDLILAIGVCETVKKKKKTGLTGYTDVCFTSEGFNLKCVFVSHALLRSGDPGSIPVPPFFSLFVHLIFNLLIKANCSFKPGFVGVISGRLCAWALNSSVNI